MKIQVKHLIVVRNIILFASIFPLIIVSMSLAGLFGWFSGTSTNDSSQLRSQNFNSSNEFQSVLGASSKDKNPCPEDKPVIGWIDYGGRKVIRFMIAESHEASACFTSIEEAEQNGYKNQSHNLNSKNSLQ